ncbi:MAG: acyl-CoA dehydrogenase family protein [Planctomycetota bacterium]|nr:acyl-CoA dehydrogenase family protein [Planctomycetota bacterium]
MSTRFDLTSEQADFLERIDTFAREELYPHAQRMDDEDWFPDDFFKRMGDAGFLGVSVPTEWGGQGLSIFEGGLILQALGRWNHGLALAYLCHDSLCMNTILRNADDEQKQWALPDLCAGTKVGALAMTEPEAGSDLLGSISTTARKDGDGYILNGTKKFIGNGPTADILMVMTRADPQGGLSAFMLPSDSPGFEVVRNIEKMGFRGTTWGELSFENCRLPAESLVGGWNRGHRVIMRGLDIERALAAGIGLGIAERALELCVERAKERRQFGKAIGNYQLIQDKLAGMYVRVETMRTMTYRALAAAEDTAYDQGGVGEIHKLTAAAVLYVGESLNWILNQAVQIWGARGYAWEYEINRLFRAIKVLEIGGGTTEVRKLIIGQELMR